MPTVSVNGQEISYSRAGSGGPVLLIPGYTCDTTMWAGSVELLADDHTVIAIDNRDMGASASFEAEYTVADLAADAVGVCRLLGLADVTVVGHSMGGAVAQQFAVDAPELVKRLVLVNSFRHMGPVSIAALDSHLRLRASGAGTEQLVRVAIPWFYGPDVIDDDAAFGQVLEALMAGADLLSIEAQSRQFRALCGFDSVAWVGQVAAPTLVVASECDLIVPASESAALAAAIPGAELVTVPRAGHVMPVELPGRFVELVVASS